MRFNVLNVLCFKHGVLTACTGDTDKLAMAPALVTIISKFFHPCRDYGHETSNKNVHWINKCVLCVYYSYEFSWCDEVTWGKNEVCKGLSIHCNQCCWTELMKVWAPLHLQCKMMSKHSGVAYSPMSKSGEDLPNKRRGCFAPQKRRETRHWNKSLCKP